MDSLTKKQTTMILEDCNYVLDKYCFSWDNLREKKLFLSGGTGFFGKWFLHAFLHINRILQLDSTITVLSRAPEKFINENTCFAELEELHLIMGDIRSFVLPNNSYDYLIHAATPASAKLAAENPDEMYSIIVDGTKHVLDFAKHTGVKKILLTSSGAVYGIQPPDLTHISENYLPDPVTTYGIGKLESERLCIESGIDTAIARCFAFVGPFLPLDIHYAIGNFIRDALEGNTITVKGDGRPYRSYLYAADLMVWLWTILLEGVPGTAYNVGSENAVSIAELAKIVSEYFTPKTKIQILGKSNNDVAAPRYVPDTSKAHNELNLRQSLLRDDGIQRTIEWRKKNNPIKS